MSGVLALREAVLTALRGDGPLMALVNAVEDGSAPKISAPALMVNAFAATEWGARGVQGLTVRVPLTLIDRRDAPARLDAMCGRTEAAMDGLPEQAGDWRIGTVRLDRARTVRSADGQWSMLVDYVVRLSRLG